MLRQLMQGTSWIALRAPDDEKGTPEQLGDPHGDEVLVSGLDPDEPPIPEPKAEEPPAPTSESPPEPPKPEPPKPKADWKDKEMGRRARRIDEERTAKETALAEKERLAAENRQLQELLANAGQQDGSHESPPVQPRQADPERRYTRAEIDAEAKRLTDEREFKQNFDNAYQAGATQFGKPNMEAAIARISELGGLDYDHLQMVLATDEPAKVLHDLGSKPEEFQRIMELPFNRRVAEFVKMGLKTEPRTTSPSRAPAPVEPISGRGGSVDNRYDDRAADADWFAAEEKRAEAAWKNRKRI